MKATNASFMFIVLMFLTGMFLLASCAPKISQSQANFAQPSKPKVAAAAPEIKRTTLDYKGASLGSEIPQWTMAIAEDDYERVEKEERFKDRQLIFVVEYGKNLDLLRSWANNFSAQAQVSRLISNKVQAQFGGIQEGDKNSSDEADSYLKEIVATLSNIKISGLRKERDFWIKVRIVDNEKQTTTEQYEYYLMYSINKQDLQRQIDIELGKISAETQKKRELKAEVSKAMKALTDQDMTSTPDDEGN